MLLEYVCFYQYVRANPFVVLSYSIQSLKSCQMGRALVLLQPLKKLVDDGQLLVAIEGF